MLQRIGCISDSNVNVDGDDVFLGSLFPSNFTSDGGLRFSGARSLQISSKRGWGLPFYRLPRNIHGDAPEVLGYSSQKDDWSNISPP